jgi:hypothetical protein
MPYGIFVRIEWNYQGEYNGLVIKLPFHPLLENRIEIVLYF